MPTSRYQRVFVVGAYLPNGGTWMAYHLGRILERDFGIPAIAVTLGGESADNGVHEYDLRMPALPVAEMERQITEHDLLLVNPSFSPHQFGWRLPGFKISYVQDFKTFVLLDRKFDHYVAVSDFVRDFLRTVYALDVNVIPPFIDTQHLPDCPPWEQRPAREVLPYRKGLPEVWDVSFARVRELLAARAPHIVLREPLPASGIAQHDLLARIGSTRYLLMLSAAEGFGLVPLEAMALGTVVAGYDAFGGRHYLRNGENCLVAPYPEIERIVTALIAAVDAPESCAALVRNGRATAAHYSYDVFRARWIAEFAKVLRMEAAHHPLASAHR